MTHLEVLVEEESAEIALKSHLLPAIIQQRATCKVVNLGSKDKLRRNLESRLRAYQKRIDKGEALRLLVLVDRDADDCKQLKAELEDKARRAKLSTHSDPDEKGRFAVVNRIVVEELESWFLGDPMALRRAFPSLPAINEKKGVFANPDNGGTWEALHRYLKRNGIYRKSYPKKDAARRIAAQMDVDRNRSASFHAFRRGVEAALS